MYYGICASSEFLFSDLGELVVSQKFLSNSLGYYRFVLKTLDVSSSNLLFSLKIPDNKSLCIVHFQLGYTNEGVICQINWSFVGGNQKTDI